MTAKIKTYRDPESGVEVTQLTDYTGHSHHFYFTNPGWYNDGRNLLISSDRNNRTNLYGVDITTGEIEQLTDLDPVPLPRELEFLRASKNPLLEEVYFWHDLQLVALDLTSKLTRILFELDPCWCVSMTNCTADGKYVFFGSWLDLSDQITTDLLRGYVGFREIWQARPQSQIVRVAVDGKFSEVVFEEDYWIGHVNTSPTQPDLLTFCHEGPWDKVDHRIWGMQISTGEVWKIRPTKAGEIVGHEYWFIDGIQIGYHGHTSQGKSILGRIRFDNTMISEHDFPGQTGHIFSLDEQVIVGDGSGDIRVWQMKGNGYSEPRVLCRHDSGMRIQQTHPHPRISPNGDYVVFTSDRSGYGNVYKVPLVEFASLPMCDTPD
jgi:oligogalacturonide lyase